MKGCGGVLSLIPAPSTTFPGGFFCLLFPFCGVNILHPCNCQDIKHVFNGFQIFIIFPVFCIWLSNKLQILQTYAWEFRHHWHLPWSPFPAINSSVEKELMQCTFGGAWSAEQVYMTFLCNIFQTRDLTEVALWAPFLLKLTGWFKAGTLAAVGEYSSIKVYSEWQFTSARAVVLDVGERMKTSLMMDFWMCVITLGKYGIDFLGTHVAMIKNLCMSYKAVEKILLLLA